MPPPVRVDTVSDNIQISMQMCRCSHLLHLHGMHISKVTGTVAFTSGNCKGEDIQYCITDLLLRNTYLNPSRLALNLLALPVQSVHQPAAGEE